MQKSIKTIIFYSTSIFSLLIVQAIALADNHNLEQAKQLYHQGRYGEAVELLETAIESHHEKQNQQVTVSNVIARRNLALAYQKLGQWQQAANTLEQATRMMETVEDQGQKSQLLAQILEVRGQIELSLGRSPAALQSWQEAANLYQQQGNLTSYTQVKIYEAISLQTLGLYSQSIKILTAVNQRLDSQSDSQMKAQALLNLGNVLSRLGEYELAAQSLAQGLTIAQQRQEADLVAEILLSLGNNAQFESKTTAALAFYQRAIATDADADLQLRAKLDRLDVLISSSQIVPANREAQEISQLLKELPPGQTTIQAKVSLARNLLELERPPMTISHLLLEAVREAQALKISRLEADALGILGSLYEQNQQFAAAERITEKALLIAQSVNARELTYQWQWQLGRILVAQGKTEQAIAVYTQATDNLQALRSDLIAISSSVRYSFREQIEPVYRQLASLLLHPDASQAELNQGREIIESLQIAELDNFFREACLDAEPQSIEAIDPDAAVLYAIILPDRLAIILSQPGKPLQYHQSAIAASEVERTYEDLYANLSPFLSFNQPLQPHQAFYNWLIRPFEAQLQNQKSDTLVFILDGVMRGIPMAALHDGEQYLIEKYNLVLTPGLQLQSSPSVNSKIKTIAGGISESHQGFNALPNVATEVTQVANLVPSEVLLNQNFTRDSLQQQIASLPYPVVHLATHGQFSSRAEDTYLLTWNDRINVKNLDYLLQNRDFSQRTPIELLILSACQTAAGDNNAALGLAGVAIRSGARSTVATLWSIQDDSTAELITQFYQALTSPGTSKAEALRQAQLSLLRSPKYSHPYYWSAFVLVGNWL